MNTVIGQIEAKIKGVVKGEKVELVELKAFNSRGKITVRCLVDYPEGGITLEECSRLNKAIFKQLQELLSGADYTVEVNSPGLDRPLRQRGDFLKAKDKVVLFWFREPVLGKQFMEAKVEAVKQDEIILNHKENRIAIDLNKIKLGKQKFRT